MSTQRHNKKRILKAVTDEPQTANPIFEKSAVHAWSVLERMEREGKVTHKVCKMAIHPYFTTKLWYRADAENIKFPVYRNARLEAVFAAVTHEPQTTKQIMEASGLTHIQDRLKKLEEIGEFCVHVRRCIIVKKL